MEVETTLSFLDLTSSLHVKRNPPSLSVCLAIGLRRNPDDDDEGSERRAERKEGRKCSTHERKCFEKGKKGKRKGRKRATDREQIDLTRGN